MANIFNRYDLDKVLEKKIHADSSILKRPKINLIGKNFVSSDSSVHGRILNAMKSLYDGSSSCVGVYGGMGEWYSTT